MKKIEQATIAASEEWVVSQISEKISELMLDKSNTKAEKLRIDNSDIYDKLFDDLSLSFLQELKERGWSISRDDLESFCLRAYGLGDVLNPILLAMAWGYGAEDVGPSRVYRYYQEAVASNFISNLRQELQSHEVNYGQLLKQISGSLTGVGDVFASKILYALSFGIKDKKNLPIILDRRVVRSLRKVINDDQVRMRYCSFDAGGGVTNITKDKYNIFCREISLVGERLNMSSADVENVLFNWRGGVEAQ